MISFDEAQALIAAHICPLGSEDVALAAASGRVLAQDLTARMDSPRYAVAAMDGYAVCDATTQPDQPLRVIGESRAGAGFTGSVAAGQAVRIFTGAPMPEGADRCIMQESAAREGDSVRFAAGYGPGWHVRAPGSDFTAGATLLRAGTRLTARAMIGAAAADAAQLSVSKQPRVAIIGTGDELAPPGTAHLGTDLIPESVTFGVAAMVAEAGGLCVSKSVGADDLSALEAAAQSALDVADLVVVTGGASVGERDFAKPMFAAHGLDLLFTKVAIKPGKPVWIGQAAGSWIVGLPGNPTSAMVTARLFLAPVLARLQGQVAPDLLAWRHLPLAAPLPSTGDRETFVRARWEAEGLMPLGNQDSGAQQALSEADWLIRCAAGQPASAAGELVHCLNF